MLSIIIPAYNEEKRLPKTLHALTKFLKASNYEVIVVVDGTDDTKKIVSRYSKKNPRITLLSYDKRLGKGGAVREGFLAAKGDCVLYDADGSTPPTQIPKLLKELKNADVVIGSRALPQSKVNALIGRRIIGRAFNFLVNLLFGLNFSDTQCGFKLFRKQVAKKLAQEQESVGYEFDVELLARAKRKGLRIKEVPIEWRHEFGGPIEKDFVLKTALEMMAGLLKLKIMLSRCKY